MGMIKPTIASQRQMFGKKYLRPHTERHPLHPVILCIHVLHPLEQKDRHQYQAMELESSSRFQAH
jgi:hypothetical protein